MQLVEALGEGTDLLIVGFLVLAAVLCLLAREERKQILVTTGFFAFAVLLDALARIPAAASAAPVLRGLSILIRGVTILNLLGIGVFRVVLPRIGLELPRILQDVTMAVAYLIWAFSLLQILGWDPTTVIATSAVVTAAVALALQDTLGNIVGGLAIQLEKSIKIGDWVQVENTVGRVVDVRWRYTAIETRNWETAVVPNSFLVKNRILLLGQREGQPVKLRRWVWFNVDYRYSPTKVIEAVQSAIRAANIPNVAHDPPPNCVQMEFADSYARYAVRYWLTNLAVDDPTDSAVRSHIYSALSRANISPSIPAQAIFVTEETQERKQAKEQAALTRKEQAIRRVDIFSHLKPEELAHLAENLVAAPFVADDVMTRQGSEGHWLYIVVDGTADVIVENKNQSVTVAQLGPGSFFGEWSLLTGEPRHATVVARTDVSCYRLDKHSFEEILRSRPEIAEETAATLAKRRIELDAKLENLDAAARARRLSHAHSDILVKLRHFFGMERRGHGPQS
jgi:small-conductance mechanosensitive channel